MRVFSLRKLSGVDAHPHQVGVDGAGVLEGVPCDADWPLQCQGVEIAATARSAVLARVDATLVPGRFTAILGPNGAGKSTLLAAMVGLGAVRSGRITLGRVPLKGHQAALARRLAVMPQETQIAFAFSAQEVVEMGRYPHRLLPAADEADIPSQAMQATGVAHLAPRDVSTLSGGERARVHMARALAQVWHVPKEGGARWLLLDEPTAALDLQHQHHCMHLLQTRAQQGFGVVAVLHDLNLALRYADDVLLVPGGGQATRHGPAREVLNCQAIREVWKVEGEMVSTADGVAQFLFAGGQAHLVQEGDKGNE